MLTHIRFEPFDPYDELANYQASGNAGAESIFIGSMRGDLQGDDCVSKMLIEH